MLRLYDVAWAVGEARLSFAPLCRRSMLRLYVGRLLRL